MSTPLVTVRRAEGPDRASALALWTALHLEHEAQDDRYRMAEDAQDRWATDFGTWVRSDADRIWLAEHGGETVGLLTAHLYTPAPTFQPALMVYVDDLYVAPSSRRLGVAALLLDEARIWAYASGATEIRAGVLATNPAGRTFWARQGGSDLSVVVAIPL